MTVGDLGSILNRLYPSSPWPKPFGLLQTKAMLASGRTVRDVANLCGTTQARVRQFAAASNPMVELFSAEQVGEKSARLSRQMLGNLIVGRCAERLFVERYKKEAATTELTLSDVREGRSDTDYRLMNGKGRPVYRINIKFIGSQFQRAEELVGLQPADSFALATYKIHAATEKQEADKLPFLFVVVSVPGLSADDVGGRAPSELLEFLGLVTQATGIAGKRDIQDAVVDYLEAAANSAFLETFGRIEHGVWYVLSARKADKLLREKLFERVYALRIRGFAQQFRGAELNMHFSLSGDLTPLDVYLHTLRESGYPMVTTLLERGDY